MADTIHFVNNFNLSVIGEDVVLSAFIAYEDNDGEEQRMGQPITIGMSKNAFLSLCQEAAEVGKHLLGEDGE